MILELINFTFIFSLFVAVNACVWHITCRALSPLIYENKIKWVSLLFTRSSFQPEVYNARDSEVSTFKLLNCFLCDLFCMEKYEIFVNRPKRYEFIHIFSITQHIVRLFFHYTLILLLNWITMGFGSKPPKTFLDLLTSFSLQIIYFECYHDRIYVLHITCKLLNRLYRKQRKFYFKITLANSAQQFLVNVWYMNFMFSPVIWLCRRIITEYNHYYGKKNIRNIRQSLMHIM